MFIKEKKVVATVYLKANLIDGVRKYAEEQGLNTSGVLNLAIRDFLQKQEQGGLHA